MIHRLFAAIIVFGIGIGTIRELGSCYGEEASVNQIKEPELAAELRKRFESDQAARRKFADFYKENKILGDDRDLAKLDPPTAQKWEAIGKEIAEEDTKNRMWM